MLSEAQKKSIEDKLRLALRNKFANYSPESSFMPFHNSLLGIDRMALFSFIRFLKNNFGTTIFEPLACEIGKAKFNSVTSQATSGKFISQEAKNVIDDIVEDLRAVKNKPNKNEEIEKIRKVCQKGEQREVKPTKVDIKLESHDGELFLIDLKSAKPNKGEFQGFKRTLLEWVAVTLYENPDAKINTLVAIPYNPYEPSPYARWTMAGMLDLDYELKVGKELWDFLGGDGAYEEILQCFEKVGLEMRQEIDDYFKKFLK